MMNQDKGLALMHPEIAMAPALQATLVYQPACCQFGPTVILGEMWHPGIFIKELLSNICCHNRILEKAASITQYFGIGQFLAANSTHRLGHFQWSRLCRDSLDQITVI